MVLDVVFTLHVKSVHGSSFLKLFLELVLPTLLTVVANWANLETKFLVPFSKIGHSYINDRECVGHRSIKFQHRPLLTRACLQAKMIKRLKQCVCVCALTVHVSVAHLTPVVQCTDVMCVLVGELLAVAASEA